MEEKPLMLRARSVLIGRPASSDTSTRADIHSAQLDAAKWSTRLRGACSAGFDAFIEDFTKDANGGALRARPTTLHQSAKVPRYVPISITVDTYADASSRLGRADRCDARSSSRRCDTADAPSTAVWCYQYLPRRCVRRQGHWDSRRRGRGANAGAGPSKPPRHRTSCLRSMRIALHAGDRRLAPGTANLTRTKPSRS